LDEHRPDVIDNFFQSNALFVRLYERDKVLLDGGEQVRVNFIYDKLPGGSYSGLGPFAIVEKQNETAMRFDWAQNYSSFTLPGIDIFKNFGPHKIHDLVGSKATSARMTLADNVAIQLFGDGSVSTDIVGLRLALAATGTYGGIVRGSDPVGTAIVGNVDATGGVITVPRINRMMGIASRGGAEKPDLLFTTQLLWDAIWSHVQPQQQYPTGPGFDDLARVGFTSINISGAALIADSHVPAGYLFGLNTKFIEFYIGEGYDFFLRGPFPLHGQDGFTAQVILYAQLAVQAPNLCFMMSGLTE
jgi:hypothetical protein